MAEHKPNSSRPSPGERALENSAGVQRVPPCEPLPTSLVAAATDSPSSDRRPPLVGFPADQTLSVCWPVSAGGSSDVCVPAEPLENGGGLIIDTSRPVLQLDHPVRSAEVIAAPGQDDGDDSAMMDALGCRSGLDFNVGDRYGADSTYATLTPLQPLPPISAVSERLGSGVVLMHGGSCVPPGRDAGHAGMQAYSPPYSYHQMKDEVEVCPPTFQQQQQLPNSPDSRIDSSVFAAAHYMRYGGGSGGGQNLAAVPQQMSICKSEFDNGAVLMNPSQSEAAILGDGQSVYANSHHQLVSPLPGGQQLKAVASTVPHGVENNAIPHGGDVCSARVGCMLPLRPVDQPTATLPCRASSPDQPSSSTDVKHDAAEYMTMSASANKMSSCGEEISTRDVALHVSSELKRYSIPQAVFAQRILGRSQGTLSDLLRNPKPWSKLKSGRETFRRMWKWLQEPEYQRMAALRAGQSVAIFIQWIVSLLHSYNFKHHITKLFFVMSI